MPIGVRHIQGQPVKFSNLQVWFDASAITGLTDGSALTTWNDISGNSFNATQVISGKQFIYKANQLNGRAAVQCADTQFMLADGAASSYNNVGGITNFCVAKRTSTNTNGNLVISQRDNGNISNRSCLFFGSSVVGFTNNYLVISRRVDGGSFTSVGSSLTIDTSYHVIVTLADFTNNIRYVYVDGILDKVLYNTAEGSGNASNTNSAHVYLSFDSGSAAGYSFIGFMAEVGSYNKVLSKTEVLLLSHYLKYKWGL